MKYKILHIGDIASVPQNLRDGQRLFGYKSDIVSFSQHPFRYSTDIQFATRSKFPLRSLEMLIKFLKIHYKYDLYHFHQQILPYGLDLPIWKIMGKKIVIHYHGSEIRRKKQSLFHKWFADLCIVSTPDLLEFVKGGIWIPNPIDTTKFINTDRFIKTDKIKILHAPSNRSIKGTEFVIKGISKLNKEGYCFELIILEKASHDEVIKHIKIADIIVDQLLLGWYGVFSIEAMAMGKPVICFIREELRKINPDLPIINTSANEIYDNLKKLYNKPDLIREIGGKSRKYVKNIHDYKIITKKLIELYDNI